MTLSIGVLTVRGKDYHPTRRLAEAAVERNASVLPIHPYHVQPAYHQDKPVLHGDPAAAAVQVVLPRQGAEIKTACLPLIEHYEQMGVWVVNGQRSILMARNKFFMLQAMMRRDLAVPDTIFAASIEGCVQAREHFAPHPVVLKPINGRQGAGLHCLLPNAPVPEDIREQLDQGRGVLVQAFIPPDQRRDLRVLVIGDTVAGAVELSPPEGDFRANVHVGSQPAAVELSSDLAAMAVNATRAMEMEIAGVDMMLPSQGRPLVIEVNSAPGFKGMESATGLDIAAKIVEYVMTSYLKK